MCVYTIERTKYDRSLLFALICRFGSQRSDMMHFSVYFATKEVRIFEECLRGINLGDFYIDCDL